MYSPPNPLDRDTAIAQAMRENDLDAMFRGQLEHYLALDDDRYSWAECCHSVCDPCVLKLARTVARVRELLAPPAENKR